MLEIRLEEMMGLCYATERLLKDASALEAIISKAFVSEAGFKLDTGIIRGTGAGQPQGILNSGALISQAKESGQATATVVSQNVINMYARMRAPNAMRAKWYVNQEIWPQLFQMNIAVGTGGIPVFLPPGGLSSAPFGNLLGRPIVPIEQTSALGSVGDIIFADLGEYVLASKGGVQSDSSMHVRFLYNEMTYRFNWRINGRSAWKTPITPYQGSKTQSPFIALAAR
jgi:HK97 family phage major capsid protein